MLNNATPFLKSPNPELRCLGPKSVTPQEIHSQDLDSKIHDGHCFKCTGTKTNTPLHNHHQTSVSITVTCKIAWKYWLLCTLHPTPGFSLKTPCNPILNSGSSPTWTRNLPYV